MSDKPTIKLAIYPKALAKIEAGEPETFEFPDASVIVSIVNDERETHEE